MITREEILKTQEYWNTKIQIEIYRCAEKFMREHEMNRTQFAEYLEVSKGYVTQILNGDYNFSLSKMVELALKIGFVPEVQFTEVEQVIQEDLFSASSTILLSEENGYITIPACETNNAA